MRNNNYEYGTNKELKVARSLRARGASVTVSKGSRGAADLKATFSTGKKWNIQVKASRNGIPASPSTKDLGRLKQSATKTGATAVVASVSDGKITYSSARSQQRTLNPPKRRA